MANFELDSYIISSSLHSNHDDFDSYAKYRSSSLISDIDSLSSINDSQSSSSPTLASNVIDDMDSNNNYQFNFRSSQESLFGCSSQKTTASSSSSSTTTQETNYSSSGYGGYDDLFDISVLKSSSKSTTNDDNLIGGHHHHHSNNNDDNRTQTRRLKNRESAARSRQKIKNQLQNLELQQKQLLNKKQAIANEISVAYKEIDRIESSFYDLKINQIGGLITKNKINHNDDHQNYQHHTINMINPFNVVGTKIKTEKDEPLSSIP